MAAAPSKKARRQRRIAQRFYLLTALVLLALLCGGYYHASFDEFPIRFVSPWYLEPVETVEISLAVPDAPVSRGVPVVELTVRLPDARQAAPARVPARVRAHPPVCLAGCAGG